MIVRKLNCESLAFWLLAAVLTLMILQPLWLKSDINWLSNTRLLFGGIILLTFLTVAARFFHLNKTLRAADYFIGGFILLAVLSWFWSENRDIYILGLRYSVFAALFYFIGRALPFKKWPWEKVLYWSLYLAGSLAILQLVLWQMGLENLAEKIGLGAEHFAGSWPRLQGSLAGPNHLATFITVSSLWLFWRKRLKPWELAVATLLVLLTLSRSAILGLAGGIIVPFLLYRSKSANTTKMAATGLILLLTTLIVFYFEPLRQVFVDARHTDLRLEIYAETVAKFKEVSLPHLLFGHGAGTAGPATFHLEKGFITENWFLQIAYEYGLAGLGMLLMTWIIVGFALRTKMPALTAIVIAILINSLFLHPLSDNALAAFWFYLLLGLGYNIKDGENRA